MGTGSAAARWRRSSWSTAPTRWPSPISPTRCGRAGRASSLPILVFPNSLPGAAAHVIAHRLIPTITDLDEARAYAAAAREPLSVFVKVDAGLERLGVPAEQAVKVITAIAELPGLRLGGVCTHLHPAGADSAYINWQFGRFTSVLDGLAAAGVEVPVKLAASSPLVMQHRHTYLNAVDPGSMLYGLPSRFTARRRRCRSCPSSARSRPASSTVKDLLPRERFAAEAPFPVPTPMRLGIIPLGTADGMATLHDGRVLVRGRAVPILSGPSLEHTRVDLTAVPEARVGDEVVVIGRQGEAEITQAEVAARHGLAPHGVALGVRERVARVYLSGGQVVSVRTRLGTTSGGTAS